MNDDIRRSLDQGGLIDITTTGRASGQPRRLEIVFHNIDGQIVISGMPRPGHVRAWIRNVEADPRITIHLKGAVHADLEGRARVVTDAKERHTLLTRVAANWRRSDVDAMVQHSPLMVVSVPGYADAAAA